MCLWWFWCSLAMADSTGDEGENPTTKQLTKKRKVTGRMSDVCRQLRAMAHFVTVQFVTVQCFKNITPNVRDELIKSFNWLGNWNDQSSYLTSLISVTLVARRRKFQYAKEPSLLYTVLQNVDWQPHNRV